jgi:hypothetical protein
MFFEDIWKALRIIINNQNTIDQFNQKKEEFMKEKI